MCISANVSSAATPTPTCINRQEAYLEIKMGESTESVITPSIDVRQWIHKTYSVTIPPVSGATAGPSKRAFQ